METWLPSVVSGLFSITVVVVGAIFIGRRENRYRTEDREREDKYTQRNAVSSFVRADRDLSIEHFHRVSEFGENPVLSELKSSEVAILIGAKANYFNSLLKELEVLDLGIHDFHVRKKLVRLRKIVRRKYEEFIEYGETIYNRPHLQQNAAFAEYVTNGISDSELRDARRDLLDTARDRFRWSSPSSDELPEMYTPPN